MMYNYDHGYGRFHTDTLTNVLLNILLLYDYSECVERVLERPSLY